MLDEETLEYFRRRERAERSAAKNAESDAARRVHQELAQEYSELLQRSGQLTRSFERFGDNPIELRSLGETGFEPPILNQL